MLRHFLIRILSSERPRGEWQIASLKHVDDHYFFTLAQGLNILPVVGVCVNRICTVHPLPILFRQSSDAPHQLAPRLDAVFLAADGPFRG